ncbi:hypothetical protein [Methanothermococcus okinawensis]|uniref:Uncharacterized protein n=1 Tax=Methanothermococcus okinawensis (strain DSM 14208 / JCM 11175 / IH1) TaxID=647113 RepID=F8AKL2_METOI|nr:hypothetical protein [Methanothermococcus okinawensis]AEH07549.1 hypothetical protein Metok_1586 [Methanothermococcus okinawensis IH1]
MGIFKYFKKYNLDKFTLKTVQGVVWVALLWLSLIIGDKLKFLFNINSPAIALIGSLIVIVSIFGLGILYIKIIKKCYSSNSFDKGMFLINKWALYPLKWYIFWILVFMGICMLFLLYDNGIITLPEYINNVPMGKIFIAGVLSPIFELIPVKINFYENGVSIGGNNYSYKNIEILEKGDKKIITINNIPYIIFDRNKDINYTFGLNNINILR